MKISVCIPVYQTEKYLEECLESVCNQTFKDFEIIIVNDCDNIKECDDIVDKIKNKYKEIPITYIKHDINKGIVETRRTAILNAKGYYIYNLDSDDYISNNCLDTLYRNNDDFDIIQGDVIILNNDFIDDSFKLNNMSSNFNFFNKADKILLNSDILNEMLLRKISYHIWNNLIKREIYLKAFNYISHNHFEMLENFIQFFWVSYFSKTYKLIKIQTYYYRINAGISGRDAKDLDTWNRLCSSPKIFIDIYKNIKDNNIKLSPIEEFLLFKHQYLSYERDFNKLNILSNKKLYDKAYEMLKNSWSKLFNLINI